MRFAIIGILFVFLLSSCTLLEQIGKDAYEHVRIFPNNEEPTDSIPVRFNAVRWRDTTFTAYPEQRYEIEKDGYLIEVLVTPEQAHFRVQRLDTMIYIYEEQ